MKCLTCNTIIGNQYFVDDPFPAELLAELFASSDVITVIHPGLRGATFRLHLGLVARTARTKV